MLAKELMESYEIPSMKLSTIVVMLSHVQWNASSRSQVVSTRI